MPSEKELGKLSIAQVRELLKAESEEGPLVEGMYRDFASRPDIRDRFSRELLPWHESYELTLPEQLAAFFLAFGLIAQLKAVSESEDPQQAMMDWGNSEPPDEWTENKETNEELVKAFRLVIALANTMDSLRVFGKYLNELVAEGRDGNDKAFFDAIRIDPTVVCCSSFSKRLSRAYFEQDTKFVNALQLALKGKTKKHESQLNRVRFAIRALIEAGAINMSDDALYRLFVDTLDIYKPGEDAVKALRKHIGKQQKATTQKR